MKIGNREFDVKNKTYIMGILNVTPDSFSDGGKWNDMDHALKHTDAMIAEGADILDIGGESTRPGHTPVGAQEEIERILPVIEAVKGRFDIPISVDTYKGCVAEEALKHGADLINDIWGLRRSGSAAGNPSALEVVAGHPACGVCLMHMHRDPQTMQAAPMEGDVLPQVLSFLERAAQALQAHGVHGSRIVLDPGIGFGKTVAQNFSLLARQDELLAAGFPLVAGWSRKSSIGAALQGGAPGAPPPSERVIGSVAAALLAAERGAHVLRVHDVRETMEALKILASMKCQERAV